MNHSATYSPDDNKLRIYPAHRLSAEDYARVKDAGYRWAPKQEIFVCPAWNPHAEDLAREMCGDIDDEDKSLTERAEERADRFDTYSDNRRQDADRAHAAVAAIADNIPLGQPILVGHHSEKHARRDAERIENGMRKTVRLFDTAQYWQQRAAGAIRHAKYKERPDVRARRIKTIEADRRKQERSRADSRKWLTLWSKDGLTLEQAQQIANYCHLRLRDNGAEFWSAYDVLRPEEERYKACPAMTVEQVVEAAKRAYPASIAWCERWIAHYDNRLTYERAMLDDAGGTATDQTGPEQGGAVRCWVNRGGWSYVQKVNKVSVSVLDNWGNGGKNFNRTITFDKCAAVMTRAQVEEARAAGRLQENSTATGFRLLDLPEPIATAEREEPAPMPDLTAMREQLRNGVQVVTANQLFPTPKELAAVLVDLADIEPGHRVLEPSAGTGALLGAMGGRMFDHNPEGGCVHAVEINPKLAGMLQAQFPLTMVHCADFLTFGAETFLPFDRIVMNPPFENGADIKHIERALLMLKPGGKLVAICANGPRQAAAFRDRADHWEELEEDTFRGTSVRAALLVMHRPQ